MVIMIRDNRGKYQRNSIFDFYPDLKEHVHEYCVTRASERNASFKINDIIVASKKYMKENHPLFNDSENLNIVYNA